MIGIAPRPVLAAVARVATEATRASKGLLLLAVAGGDLEALVTVASADPASPERPEALAAGQTGLARYVIATGQPQALTEAPAHGESRSALCVPCICDGEVVGALELVDKAGGGAFSIDDLELASLLGGIAGVAIAKRLRPQPADPARLAGDLQRLAAANPARYATVAWLLKGVLDA